MSSSQNPAPGNDAPRDDAPPTLQPPGYSELAELPAEVPQSNIEPPRDAVEPEARTKSEASAYVGSYRPAEAQAPTLSVAILVGQLRILIRPAGRHQSPTMILP